MSENSVEICYSDFLRSDKQKEIRTRELDIYYPKKKIIYLPECNYLNEKKGQAK